MFDEPKITDEESIAFFSSSELQCHIDMNESLVVEYFLGKKLTFPDVVGYCFLGILTESLTTLQKTKIEFPMTIYEE